MVVVVTYIMGRLNDLTGKKFGKLTVLKRVGDYISPKGQHKTQWMCICDCGNKIIATGNNLIKKNTTSCGCFKSEHMSDTMKKYNRYDLSGDYGIGYTLKGEKFLFDLEDYDKIKDYCWHITKRGYVATRNKNKKGARIRFHRLVIGLPNDKFDVDHIHGKESRYDNRKENLRLVTRSQNNMNSALAKNNTSGATGVYYHKSANKWAASIMINYNSIHLGLFDTFDDALKAREDAEEKYFGKFSYNNSQKLR